MVSDQNKRDALLGRLTQLFSYKGEWLDREIFKLFKEPVYFPELVTNQSCVIIGGRGTGKTTALRGLSYEGRRELKSKSINEWEYYGIYYKVDSNRVSALTGMGVSTEMWARIFSHYINLLISDLVVNFLLWHQKNQTVDSHTITTEGHIWRRFEKALALVLPSEERRTWSLKELSELIDNSLIDFELYINNIMDDRQDKPSFSIAAGPIDALFAAVSQLVPFQNKSFFLLIDEYESFSDYQQKVINTLVKQSAGKSYCFKIAVKELGWRVRHTSNEQELRSPSDYRRISITEKLNGTDFKSFALKVCNNRLKNLVEVIDETSQIESVDVRTILPKLSMSEEAQLLGVEKRAEEILGGLKKKNQFKKLDAHLVWFASEWGKTQGLTTEESLKGLEEDPSGWKKKFENHGFAYLFAIRDGKRGVRKYYAGWEVYVLMAAGNIRFLLQLVEASLREHIKSGHELSLPISPENQTKAASSVGISNFEELEGIDPKGAKIMRLLLGLGRIFQIFAFDPFGHAPELNQFFVPQVEGSDVENDEKTKEAYNLLNASVNHLALQRANATKLGRKDPKGYDYWIHPVYSAFFQISHRKKRKTKLSPIDIMEIVNNQGKAVENLMVRHGRDIEENVISNKPVPSAKNNSSSQLSLFIAPEKSVS